MSKGKYLEFHDLDSIVKIGSFSYHVKKKQITGYTVQETKTSEATLKPEIISRWFSPDPLSDEFTSWTPYHFVHNNPINLIDPDGRAAMPPDWVENASGEIYWDDNATSQATTKAGETYLGKAVVVMDGSAGENLDDNGKLTGEDANSAKTTIYGPGGANDVQTYDGLTMTSDPNTYSQIASGDYEGSHEQMATAPFSKGSLTYRIKQLNGDERIPIEGEGLNKQTGLTYMSQIFFHRTNNSGFAGTRDGGIAISKGCPVVCGTQWRGVEKQLGEITSFRLRIIR